MRTKLVVNWMLHSGIGPGCDDLVFEEYVLCMENARKVFGDKFCSFLQDCFTPHGKPVNPGIEDSLSLYSFNVNSWAEFEDSWEEFND